MPALLLLTGPSSGLRYEIKSEVTLGRSSACEVPLEDSKVSRRHAHVEIRGGQAFLSDMGSRNGTLLNGERVAQEMILRPNDRFQVGDTTVLFEPTARETVEDETQADFDAVAADTLLPTEGLGGYLVTFSKAAMGALSGPAVLRRGAEQLLQRVGAEWVSVLINQPDGLVQACAVGTATPVVPRALATRVLGRGEAVWDGGGLCVPLGVANSGTGVLFVERSVPFTPDERQLVVASARLLGEMWQYGKSTTQGLAPSLVGSADTFRSTLEQVRKTASAKEHVLLLGEAGSGKRTLAEYLHARSSRAPGACVVVDCREPVSVVEDTLFGRPPAPGVSPLTSALARADGGTLVLHHMEALGKTPTERLARHLTRRTAPGTTGDEVKVDVRVIATSSSAVFAMNGAGQQPLVTALGATEIKVPPLRERIQDIPDLFAHFANGIVARLRKPVPTLTGEAVELLAAYRWPYNVEELRLIAERLAFLYPGDEVATYRFPSELQKTVANAEAPNLQAMIERLEKDVISEALRQAKGKKIKAAALLDISRPTLDKKIEDYNLKVEKVRDE